MKNWFFTTYFFSNALFFVVLSFFSVTYNEDSIIRNIYNRVFVVLIMVTVLMVLLHKSVKQSKSSGRKFFMLCLVLSLLIATVYGYYKFGKTEISYKILMYVLGLTIPSTFLALCIDDKSRSFFDKVKYINIFITIGFGIPILKGYIKFGEYIDIAGSTHLIIGYTMSILFAYNLISLINSKKTFGKILYIGLILSNIAMVVFSGSRGSVVCLVSISMVMLWSNRKKITFLKGLLTLIALCTGMYILINKASNSFALQRMLLAFDGRMGGRNIFYNKAIDMIVASPILGSGIGAYANGFGIYVYPHNIVLEILTDFGIVGLIIFLVIIIKAFSNLAKMLKQNKDEQLIGLLFISSFTMLLFSGSYLTNIQFWMSFVLVYTYQSNLNIKYANTNESGTAVVSAQ